MKFKKLTWILVVAMVLSLLSPTAIPTHASTFKLKDVTSGKKTLYVGSVYQIKTNASDVSFSSNKKNVAGVSATGLVSAKKKGSATITVKNNTTGKKIKLKIKVKKASAYTISKKSGNYTGSIKVKIKAKKGYMLYYTTGSKFKASKKIKSGKSKTLTIKKTKTLKLYFVKKNAKVTIKKINKTRNKSKNCVSFKYVINSSSNSQNVSSVNTGNNTVGNTTSTLPEADVSNINQSTWTEDEKNGLDTAELWNDSDPVYIFLSDSGITTTNADGNKLTGTGVELSGKEITIKNSGTYVLSGTLSDGNIVLKKNAADSTLILNGVNITSSTTAAIYANKNATNLTITLAAGSTNYLTGPDSYVFEDGEDEPDATLFVKKSLLLNGSGTLYVTDPNGDAIKCKDALKIADGNYIINAGDDGIIGKDSLSVCGGSFNITAKGDGMKTNLTTDLSLGFIDISGGDITILSEGDGIQADTTIKIENASLNITTNVVSGTSNDSFKGIKAGGTITYTDTSSSQTVSEIVGTIYIKSGDFIINSAEDGINSKKDVVIESGTFIINTYSDGIQASNNINILGGDITITTAKKSSYSFTSFKGMKAGTSSSDGEDDSTGILLIKDGTISINTLGAGTTSGNQKGDDALHSNAALEIDGGDITISAGDDAIHSDTELTINDGNIVINSCYEGLESSLININGGNTRILSASDDGVNICGGNDNSGGDNFNPGLNFGGFNSNQSQNQTTVDTTKLLHITDGYLFVNASGDGLDSNGSISMEGGTVVVYGPTSSSDAPLDFDGTFTIDGGYLLAVGSSGMAQTPSTGSQAYISYTGSKSAGTSLCLKTSAGKYLIGAVPTKSYSSVVISTPEMTSGTSYSLITGGTISGTKNSDNYYTAITSLSNGTTTSVTATVGGSGNNSGGSNNNSGNMRPGGR
jgi:hypothetical protein